jgi:hypothetical protein
MPFPLTAMQGFLFLKRAAHPQHTMEQPLFNLDHSRLFSLAPSSLHLVLVARRFDVPLGDQCT